MFRYCRNQYFIKLIEPVGNQYFYKQIGGLLNNKFNITMLQKIVKEMIFVFR